MKRLLFLSATLVACAASSEDVGSNDAFDTVHPTGGELLTSSLIVGLPAGAEHASPVITLDGRSIQPGSLVTGLAAGTHDLQVDGFHVKVDLVANRTLGYELAAFKLKLPAERVLGINHKDESGHVNGLVKLFNEAQDLTSIANPGPLDGSNPDQVFAVPPGHFHVRWGAGDGTKLEAVGGKVGVLDLDSPHGRRLVRLQAPTREFANVPSEGDRPDAWQFFGRSSDDTSWSEALAHVDDGSSLIAGIESDGLGALNFWTPQWKERLRLGDVGGDPYLQHIGRIDVDDVAVTTAQGTTKVRGRYLITGGFDFEVGFGTRSGIDVWPGTYKVVTTYATPSGDQVDTHTIVVQ